MSSAFLEFKVGENLRYPGVGHAVIDKIETVNEKKSYIIRPLADTATSIRVTVPIAKVNAVGLKKIISQKEVQAIYEILKKRNEKEKGDQTSWNRRLKQYKEVITKGTVFEIAAVLRDLFLLRNNKELSSSEKDLFRNAQSILVKEISLAKKIKTEVIEQEIQMIFAS